MEESIANAILSDPDVRNVVDPSVVEAATETMLRNDAYQIVINDLELDGHTSSRASLEPSTTTDFESARGYPSLPRSRGSSFSNNILHAADGIPTADSTRVPDSWEDAADTDQLEVPVSIRWSEQRDYAEEVADLNYLPDSVDTADIWELISSTFVPPSPRVPSTFPSPYDPPNDEPTSEEAQRYYKDCGVFVHWHYLHRVLQGTQISILGANYSHKLIGFPLAFADLAILMTNPPEAYRFPKESFFVFARWSDLSENLKKMSHRYFQAVTLKLTRAQNQLKNSKRSADPGNLTKSLQSARLRLSDYDAYNEDWLEADTDKTPTRPADEDPDPFSVTSDRLVQVAVAYATAHPNSNLYVLAPRYVCNYLKEVRL